MEYARLKVKLFWRIAILLLYLLLTCYQLGLPGLHYDEAKEAGVNAMELLTHAPVTAFRNATLPLFGKQLPLMVQDYIGALNVYLAIPFLKLTGIGVPNLRALSVLTGLATLLLLEQLVTEWLGWRCEAPGKGETETRRDGGSAFKTLDSQRVGYAPLLATTLLAVSPTFVFWSRQGIFVTNLTQPLCLWAIWQGVRWLRKGDTVSLAQAAFASGLALTAKLLAFWILVPFWGLVIGYWLWQVLQREWNQAERQKREGGAHDFSRRISLVAIILTLSCFLLAISPLLLFNWQTGGTFSSVGSNLTQSYYGVNNLEIAQNLSVRLGQLRQILQGTQFDYLGGVFNNWLAPWLALLIILAACVRKWRLMSAPLFLLIAAFIASLFTVSGLFVTHYALLQPMLFSLLGIAISELQTTNDPSPKVQRSRFHIPHGAFHLLLLFWFCFDLTNSIRYHYALSQSGGLGDHSDASYHLAYHLRNSGMGAPIVLDWGMEATVRYLSEGTVQPLEIFGYDSLGEPDKAFVDRLVPFLHNPENVYLLRAANRTVFHGRREQFLQEVKVLGLDASLETTFAQRNGEVLFELWRVR